MTLDRKTCFRVGFFRQGNCWRFRFERNVYYSGWLTYYRFWRFYLVVDRRLLDPTL